MYVANRIADQNPDALTDFIRLLGRKLQSDYLSRILFAYDHQSVPGVEPRQLWFDEFSPITKNGKCLHDIKLKLDSLRNVNLVSDIILPWPWQPDRAADCLSYIGTGKSAGKWEQDKLNHKVECD